MSVEHRMEEIRAILEQRHPRAYFPSIELSWLLKYAEMLREELGIAAFNIHSFMEHKKGPFSACRAIECMKRTTALERGPDGSA